MTVVQSVRLSHSTLLPKRTVTLSAPMYYRAAIGFGCRHVTHRIAAFIFGAQAKQQCCGVGYPKCKHVPHARARSPPATTADLIESVSVQALLPAAAEESTACALVGRLQVARILRDRREGHIRARAEPHELFDNLLRYRY